MQAASRQEKNHSLGSLDFAGIQYALGIGMMLLVLLLSFMPHVPERRLVW